MLFNSYYLYRGERVKAGKAKKAGKGGKAGKGKSEKG